MHVDLALILRHLPGALVLFAASTLVSHAQERDRSKVPDEYKWDLTAIYPSDQAWRAAKEKLASELPNLRKFQGTLASSAARLADALETQSSFDKEFTRLYVLCSHAFRRGHTSQYVSGHAAGNDSARIRSRHRIRLHRTRDPQNG